MKDRTLDPRWECGSEFHWCGLPEPPFLPWPREYRNYMLGRHAVAALLLAASSSGATLWLPSYFCPEVADACRGLCELREYEDDPSLPEPHWHSLRAGAGDFVLAVNYFGVREADAWRIWRERNACLLIEDHTQDPFSSWSVNSTADYAFASVRKTVPVPDGALLWSPRGLPLPTQLTEQARDGSGLKMSAMFYKANYLAGVGDDGLKHYYRELQARGEQRLRSSPVSAMSSYSQAYIANGVPVLWREQKLRNAKRLRKRVMDLAGADLLFPGWPEGAVPFTLPLIFRSQSERDHCQEQMRRNRIYCPVHWVCQTANSRSIDLSSRLLSLPIDHRYAESEMDRVVDALEEATKSFVPSAAVGGALT